MLQDSGVTVGPGIDLGRKNADYFKGVSQKTLDKISPHFGKRGVDPETGLHRATESLRKNPMKLDTTELAQLTAITKSKETKTIVNRYNTI